MATLCSDEYSGLYTGSPGGGWGLYYKELHKTLVDFKNFSAATIRKASNSHISKELSQPHWLAKRSRSSMLRLQMKAW